MADIEQQARANFELWATWFATPLEMAEDGDYADRLTNVAWLAWRAALASQPQATTAAVPVSAELQVIDSLLGLAYAA
jgi:hypothetical protein